MNLALKIKLLPTNEQAAKLLDAIERFNQACNLASQVAYNLATSSQVKIHQSCYYEIREKFNLPAQYAIRAIGKVVEVYRRDKKKLHIFKQHGAIVLDNRLLSYKGADRVSISGAPGRMIMPFVVGSYGQQMFQRVKGQADLVYKKGKFFLLQNCVLPDGTPIDPEGFLGIDFGITNIAVDSDGEVFSGKTIKNVRHRHRKLRTKLQKKGTKSARRLLKNLSGKETRFARDVNHCISKKIVAKAQRTGRGISIENLSHLRERVTVRRSQRATLHSWSFFQLRYFIQYKSTLGGVKVVAVDPRNTSRTCPVCGCIDKRNRPNQSTFSCIACGHSGLADLIAAGNIASRAAVNPPYAVSQL